MSVSDTPLSAELHSNIRDCARGAAGLLEISSTTPGAEAIDAVDAFIYRWQKGDRPKIDEDNDLALTLGSLWGEQLVSALGWQWATATFSDERAKMVGVFSTDRSLAIYPFQFVHGCIQNGVPVTIMLAYNMLKSGSIPKLPPLGYVNLMDGVRHVVPRD